MEQLFLDAGQWLGYHFCGAYALQEQRVRLFPSTALSIGTREITHALVNDGYPGFFRVVPILAPAAAVATRISGRYSNAAIKTFTKSFQLKSFCIASGDWSRFRRRLEDHPSWEYVRLALRFADTGDPACIDEVWRRGQQQSHARYVEDGSKVATRHWCKEHAKEYVMRVIGLAHLITEQKRVPSPEELAKYSGRRDDEIGVAIGEDGEVLHFRKGHHRIMLAKQLGVTAIDVKLHVVHSRWLRTKLGMGRRELRSILTYDTAAQGTIQETIRRHFATRGHTTAAN